MNNKNEQKNEQKNKQKKEQKKKTKNDIEVLTKISKSFPIIQHILLQTVL